MFCLFFIPGIDDRDAAPFKACNVPRGNAGAVHPGNRRNHGIEGVYRTPGLFPFDNDSAVDFGGRTVLRGCVGAALQAGDPGRNESRPG